MAQPDVYDGRVVNALIAEACREHGAQKRLADALGVRPTTVNKWVMGENIPDINRWPAIEQALNMPEHTFLRAVFGKDIERFGIPDPRESQIHELRARMTGLRDELAALDAALARLEGSPRTKPERGHASKRPGTQGPR